ncbi:MAG: helix-turn-helix domain-containing protein [Pseudonocardia sp.]
MQEPNPSPIRQRRLELGLTLRALAVRCREQGTLVSNSQLSKIERGMYVPRPALRATLRNVLGFETDVFEPSEPRAGAAV